MLELTADNVHETITDCFFKEEELTRNEVGDFIQPDGAVFGEGVIRNAWLKEVKVQEHLQDIKDFLSQLADSFRGTLGDTFLKMPFRLDGEQWGEHADAESLLILGEVSQLITLPYPRDKWDTLPGGVPYIMIITDRNVA